MAMIEIYVQVEYGLKVSGFMRSYRQALVALYGYVRIYTIFMYICMFTYIHI